MQHANNNCYTIFGLVAVFSYRTATDILHIVQCFKLVGEYKIGPCELENYALMPKSHGHSNFSINRLH